MIQNLPLLSVESVAIDAVTMNELGTSVFESSPDCVKLLDAGGHILAMNRNGQCAMEIDDFGTVQGAEWSTLWGQENRHEIEAAMAAARAGQNSTLSLECPTAKGTLRWWDVSVSPIPDHEGGIARILAVSRDITETRLAAEKMRVSEERFRSLVTATAAIVWSMPGTGQFEAEQPGWFAFTGQAFDAMKGSGWLDMVFTDDRDGTAQAWTQAISDKNLFETEHRLRRADGEFRYMSMRAVPIKAADGSVSEWVGIHTDITDRIVAEQEAQDNDERYRLALEASGNIATWVVHPETNTGFLDERFAEIFDVDLEIATHGAPIQVFTERIHDEDRTRVEEAIAEAIRTGERYDIDYRIVQRSGKVVWVTVKGKMFKAKITGKQRFAGVAVEITERKAVEDGLHDLNRRKDEFLAMLAHELRNPLAPISAAAQLLITAPLDQERIHKASQIIVRQVDHMTGLVNDLLDVSRVNRGLVTIKKEPIEIRTIIADAVEQIAPLLQARNHHLSMELMPDSVMVDVDRKRLIQVVANVINNAAKYTPPDGRVSVRTAVQEDDVLIEIADNGIGMTPDLTARVFDIFTQGHVTPDRNSGGLGLGLALVKCLVEIHGGSVTASSKGLGLGSSFVIRLPRAVELATSEAPARALTNVEIAKKALKILVVDDNIDAADTIAMLLEATGYEVLVEHGAKRALERTATENPDVCLLDIGLPEMNGNELARQIRKIPGMADAVLIALTGYGQDEDRANTKSAGFDHHFVKPIDTTELTAVLARVTPG